MYGGSADNSLGVVKKSKTKKFKPVLKQPLITDSK